MTLKTATVLAFDRSLGISDAFFWQLDSSSAIPQIKPLTIDTKSVRGTISNRLKAAIANDPVKLDAEIEKSNLQTVDVAALDHDCDTLIVKWSCKVLPFSGKPSVCNDQAYQAKLQSVVEGYLAGQGVAELSRRYAANIANARWLWRNRLGAETIKLTVSLNADGSKPIAEIADAKALDLTKFDETNSGIDLLTEQIEAGLKGQSFVMLYVKADVKMGYGQEVYPSQELILDTGKDKSKVLYQKSGFAGMHSQKLGNAIRTIDTWYPDAEFPIAAEPYGAVTTLGTAFRQPKQKQDFYSLFDNWVLNDAAPDEGQQHYVMAVLIRGGVFGASGKE
ncbi:type I-F CRISPR-associated protein Csy3 [SAR92 clade bacterium H455]|uniref:Type I-F CRISPR-associated protein Csy3 n=1 Tax=SAR92 clade bacterium H455 TaxID=2974818 RepID=A0ABY5TJR5_9GAMM|nr:type I-F CRISPR-associated protein Csy3 [SAR92 clade bacterium H455]